MLELRMVRWPEMDKNGFSAWGISVDKVPDLTFPDTPTLKKVVRETFPAKKARLKILHRYNKVLYVGIPYGIPKRNREAFVKLLEQKTSLA